MSNINTQIKDKAAPGVLEVIEWALMVHTDTMEQMLKPNHDHLRVGKYTEDEREEARKILLEYGAGKPTRVVEHRGSKAHPFKFETEIVPSRRLTPPTITVETPLQLEQINETENT